MNKIRVFLIIIVVILSNMMVVSLARGQVGIVGVSEGDWFKWSYSYSLSDERPTPAQFDIEWIKFLVTDISGTLVIGESTIKYNNGTEHTETNSIDIDQNLDPIIQEMLISTHYSVNDVIYNIEHLRIDEILTRTYNNQPREMFHSTFTARFDDVVHDHEYYWDRKTGILVEMIYQNEFTENSNLGSGSALFELKLIESNNPEIPEFSTTVIMLLFLSFTLLGTIISTRKLNHNL
jgi:hypothetical protein